MYWNTSSTSLGFPTVLSLGSGWAGGGCWVFCDRLGTSCHLSTTAPPVPLLRFACCWTSPSFPARSLCETLSGICQTQKCYGRGQQQLSLCKCKPWVLSSTQQMYIPFTTQGPLFASSSCKMSIDWQVVVWCNADQIQASVFQVLKCCILVMDARPADLDEKGTEGEGGGTWISWAKMVRTMLPGPYCACRKSSACLGEPSAGICTCCGRDESRL